MNRIIKATLTGFGVSFLASQAITQEGNPIMKNTVVINQSTGLRVYRSGPESPVNLVFIHGDSGAATQWFGVMANLADTYSVTAFDQRGHGASSSGRSSDYSYGARADDLNEVVASLGSRPTILVAHSGAAGVAFEYAKAHNESLRGMYFLDPATDPRAMPEEMRQGLLDSIRSENGLEVVQGYFSSIAGPNPETVATVIEDAAMVTPEARIGFAQSLLNWNPEAAMSHWAGPTFMAISTTNDGPTAIHHLGNSVQYQVIATEGHWPQLDTPDSVARSIRSFVEGLS